MRGERMATTLTFYGNKQWDVPEVLEEDGEG